MSFEVHFFVEKRDKSSLTRDDLHKIRSVVAKNLKACEFRIEELHGIFDWNKDGCSCEKDVYKDDEKTYFLTLNLLGQLEPNSHGHGGIFVVFFLRKIISEMKSIGMRARIRGYERPNAHTAEGRKIIDLKAKCF